MKYVVIPAEIQVREFWGRLLIATELANRGIKVIVGEQRHIFRILKYLPAGVVLLKSIAPHEVAMLQKLKLRGFKVCSLDEEAIAATKIADFSDVRFSEATMALAEKVFCWGNVDYEKLVKRYPDSKSKILQTGNPRFDLWGEPLRQLFADDAKLIKQKYGEFLLVPSNFSGLFHGSGEKVVFDYAVKTGRLKTDQEKQQFLEKQNHVEEARLSFVRMISELAEEIQVVVRPHPSENSGKWEAEFANVENVRVVSEGPITAWIMAARGLLHHCCSTGLEAAILGVPVFSYLPNYNSDFDRNISLSVSERIYSADELIGKIYSAEGLSPVLSEEIVELFLIDGPPAFFNIANVIEEVLNDAEQMVDCSMITRATRRYRIKIAAEYCRSVFKNAISFKESNDLRANEKWCGAEVGEVINFIERSADCLGTSSAVKVEGIYKNVFLLGSN